MGDGSGLRCCDRGCGIGDLKIMRNDVTLTILVMELKTECHDAGPLGTMYEQTRANNYERNKADTR